MEAQRKQLEELTALLKQTSANSSKPPSSDPPSTPAKPPRKPSGRKRGGQPGHPKYQRSLVALEQVTSIEVIKPATCRACRNALHGDDLTPYRHQVFELPRVAPTVAEFQLHSLACTRCGVRTRASVPHGVPTGQFGPRLQAMVSVASGAYRLSKRTIKEMFADFFGVSLSLGSIANLEQGSSEALSECTNEVARDLKNAPVVHADETGWYQRGKRAWLWLMSSSQVASFRVSQSRGAVVAKQMLGEDFVGFLVSDRWPAYGWVDARRRQICWAHLLRQFVGFQDFNGKSRRHGKALEIAAKELFGLWHRVRDGTLSRPRFRRLMRPIKHVVMTLLRACTRLSTPKVAGRAREILALEDALWTFVAHEGIDPTNNHAERLVRHGVIWRKTSFGTDSDAGSRFVERILTTVATLRLQKRNVLEYVEQACRAAFDGSPSPSLLPTAR